MRMLFLRVGIDTGSGGTLSPLFADNRFEYVPISESKLQIPGRGLKYSDIAARSGGSLARFVPRDRYAHLDPEFDTFTYGEPNRPKRSQLLNLTDGDFLVFYAGFQGESIAPGTCFVIGYFDVCQVHAMPAGGGWPPPSLAHLANNAHFRRAAPEEALVVVEGKKSSSRLLDRATRLSDSEQYVSPQIAEVIGFSGSIMRAVGRWVPDSHVATASAWLRGLR